MPCHRLWVVLVGVVVAGCAPDSGDDDDDGVFGPIPVPSLSGGPSPTPTPELAITYVAPAVLSVNSTLHVHGVGFSASTIALVGDVPATIESVAFDRLVLSGFVAPVGPAAVKLVDGLLESNLASVEFAAAGAAVPLGTGGLLDPRGMIVDPVDGTLLVFDAEAGLLRLDMTTNALTVVVPPGAILGAPAAGAFGPDGRLFVADDEGARLVRRELDGAWTLLAAGLAAPATSVTADVAGDLYWVDGGPSIGRVSAAGVIATAFATVPGATGVVFHGARLYVSEPSANAVHRVTLVGGNVEVAWAAGVDAPNGLFSDGAFVYAAVSDLSQGPSVVRLGVDGSVVLDYETRPILGPASSGLVIEAVGGNARPILFTADATIMKPFGGAGWVMHAVSLVNSPARSVAWIGESAYVSFDEPCDINSGGRGGIVEIVGGVYRRVVVTEVCAFGGIAAAPTGKLGWADGLNASAKVAYWDPATDAKTAVLAGTLTVGAHLATTTSGSFFVSSGTAVDYHGPTGTLLAAGVIAFGDNDTGLTLSPTDLFVSTAHEIARIPLDPLDGAPGTPVVMIGTTAGFVAIGTPFAIDGAVLFVTTGSLYSMSMDGSTTLLDDFGSDAVIRSIAPSPYGGLSFVEDGQPPRVLLP